jgi:hypothetical protein
MGKVPGSYSGPRAAIRAAHKRSNRKGGENCQSTWLHPTKREWAQVIKKESTVRRDTIYNLVRGAGLAIGHESRDEQSFDKIGAEVGVTEDLQCVPYGFVRGLNGGGGDNSASPFGRREEDGI